MKARITDIIFIIALAVIGILISVPIYLPQASSGGILEVRVNGEVLQSWSLSDDRTETIKTEYGTNIFYIQDGTAYMKDSDCHDKVCVNMRGVSNTGESIVCLPHRLVLEIIRTDSTSPAELDAVTGGAP